MTQRTVYLSFLVTCGAILISSVLQFRAARQVDAAELYALRAARDYEFAVLIQRTKELNRAALAVLRNELNTMTCVQGEAGNVVAFRYSAPLPAIPPTLDKPKRALRQVD